MNLTTLFQTSYIFDNPPEMGQIIYLVAFFVSLIIVSLLIWFLFPAKQKILKSFRQKLFNIFFYVGIVGLILCFFRWQEISYLGSRFFLLLLGLTFILILIFTSLLWVRAIPESLKKLEEKQAFEKYLPKKK